MIEHTPIRRLAINEFRRQFKDLFSVKAKIDEFEKNIIESTYELLWFDRHKGDPKEWDRTLRAAFNFLDKGFLENPEKVAMAFWGSINYVIPSLNNSYAKKIKASVTIP